MKNEELEDDFKKLLDLYEKGRLSASEKARMDEQLEDFKKSDNTPYEFNQQHADALWKKITTETEGGKIEPKRTWFWFAAAVVFASLAALLTLSWNPEITQLSNKVILGDGTIVWLKDGAHLAHSKFTVNNREVTLKGEALFEVAKMSGRPFVIHCGQYDARVVGTSFNINAKDHAVELTVLTGSVKLSSLQTDSSVLVNSHEHVVFAEKQVITKSPFNSDEIILMISETQYDMHFEDTRMAEIVRRVEGKFDVKIHLQNTNIANCMISADFTDQSLPVTLMMISEALGFHYQIDGSDVMISGDGCHE